MEYTNNQNKRLKIKNFGSYTKPQFYGTYNDYNMGNSSNYNNNNRNNYHEMNQMNNFNGEFLTHKPKPNHFGPIRKFPKKFTKLSENGNSYFNRLFILYPKEASEEELNEAFKSFGNITDISMLKDQTTQIEKGIAYIKYDKASEALEAMEQMDGKYLENYRTKALKVLISQDGNKNYKTNEPFTTRLYVKLDKSMNKHDLKNMFRKYGEIQGSYISIDREQKKSKGFGFVTFKKSSDAARALEECDPCFHARFAFKPNDSQWDASKTTNQSPNNLIKDFDQRSNLNETNSPGHVQSSVFNFDHLNPYNYQREKENISRQQNTSPNLLTNNSNQTEINNNNSSFQNKNLSMNEDQSLLYNYSETSYKLQLSDESLINPPSPLPAQTNDKDCLTLSTRPKNALTPEIVYPFDIVNHEHMASDFVLKIQSKLAENFVKSVFDLIPGLQTFKMISDDKYVAKYTNDLLTYYAMQKMSKFELPSGESFNVLFIKESDLYSIETANSTKTKQILVIINSGKDLTNELLHLIMNQFKSLINCRVLNDNRSGFAIFSNEQDAALAVNTIDNRIIAMNLLHARIEKDLDDFLFKSNRGYV